MLTNARDYKGLCVSLQLLQKPTQNSTHVNIYEESSPALCKQLFGPVPAIMEHIQLLLSKYPLDNIKNLAQICHKIQERRLSEEVYKILIDC